MAMQTVPLSQIIAGLREQLEERAAREEKLERALASVKEENEVIRAALAALVPNRPSAAVVVSPVAVPAVAKAARQVGRRSGAWEAIRDALRHASGPLLTSEVVEAMEAAGHTLPWVGKDLYRRVGQTLVRLKLRGEVVSRPSDDNRRELRWALRT